MAKPSLGVIFDMDGVLVDSYRAHYQSWLVAARGHGLTYTEADFATSFGRTSREIIRHQWPGKFDDAGVKEFDGAKESAYRDILANHFPEMNGASTLIAALHDAGFAMAIGSSGPPENVALVKKTIRHGDFISATTSGVDVTHGKPEPDIFLMAAKKLNLPPSRCAVIEDAPVGIEAARRAEMIAIGLVGTVPRERLADRAHLVVDRLSELSPAIIERLICGDVSSPGIPEEG